MSIHDKPTGGRIELWSDIKIHHLDATLSRKIMEQAGLVDDISRQSNMQCPWRRNPCRDKPLESDEVDAHRGTAVVESLSVWPQP
jgi:hypothetical protein